MKIAQKSRMNFNIQNLLWYVSNSLMLFLRRSSRDTQPSVKSFLEDREIKRRRQLLYRMRNSKNLPMPWVLSQRLFWNSSQLISESLSMNLWIRQRTRRRTQIGKVSLTNSKHMRKPYVIFFSNILFSEEWHLISSPLIACSRLQITTGHSSFSKVVKTLFRCLVSSTLSGRRMEKKLVWAPKSRRLIIHQS